MNLSDIKTTSISVQRIIEASASDVFDARLNPDCQGSPWNGDVNAILQKAFVLHERLADAKG